MNATCQVMHSTNGRIRLQVPSIQTHPEIAEILIALLLKQPGITGVQALQSNASIVIKYDPRLCTQRAIMQALGVKQLEGPDGQEQVAARTSSRPRRRRLPVRGLSGGSCRPGPRPARHPHPQASVQLMPARWPISSASRRVSQVCASAAHPRASSSSTIRTSGIPIRSSRWSRRMTRTRMRCSAGSRRSTNLKFDNATRLKIAQARSRAGCHGAWPQPDGRLAGAAGRAGLAHGQRPDHRLSGAQGAVHRAPSHGRCPRCRSIHGPLRSRHVLAGRACSIR